MKLSAKNVLESQVVGSRRAPSPPQVRVNIGGGNVITSMITVDAVDDLGI